MFQLPEILFNEDIKQILFNVIGGALVALLSWIYISFRKMFRKRAFRKIFGREFIDKFAVVYGQMKLLLCYDEEGRLKEWNYYKPGTDGRFRISTPVSIASIRAASYLFEAFGKDGNVSPKLTSDLDVKEKLDFSFCSFGGMNNFKTIDVLNSEQNTFFKFGSVNNQLAIDSIVLKNESDKHFSSGDNIDYGFIIKIVPKIFPDRVWFACAGIGEWGTSGAAWYLAKNWGKIKRIFGNKSFGVIVKVRGEQDESAEMVYPLPKEKFYRRCIAFLKWKKKSESSIILV